MNALLPGNTMNTKNFRCSYQLQCNLVFIGKFQLVICQSFLVAINKNLPFNLVPPICEIDKKFKKIFLDINFFFYKSNCSNFKSKLFNLHLFSWLCKTIRLDLTLPDLFKYIADWQNKKKNKIKKCFRHIR